MAKLEDTFREFGASLKAKFSRRGDNGSAQTPKKILLVGIYDTNSVALAPHILRAYVEQFPVSHRFQIETLELSIFNDTVDDMVRSIQDRRADIVGFSTYIWNVNYVNEIVKQLDAVTILGGPQVTELSEQMIADNPAIDIVVEGEGELAFKELLEYFAGERELSSIHGIAVAEGKTPKRAVVAELDSIPGVYQRIFQENPDITWITIETSRGCPYHCAFCTWGYSKSMRYYDIERVKRDLDIILKQEKIEFIYFCDSSLILNKRRAKPILQHIIDSGSKKAIRYEMSAEQVDDEIVELLVKLPKQEFNFGLQSISAGGQEHLQRPFRQKKFEDGYHKISQKIEEMKKETGEGPSITIDLIYGLPGDSLDGYKESLNYAISLDSATRILTNPLIVLPGADYFKDMLKHGIQLRDKTSWMVKSTASFSEEEIGKAREFSFYVSVIYLNECLRDAVKECARDRNQDYMELIIEFFQAYPIVLPNGYPDMIPAHKEDFAYRNEVVRIVTNRYGAIVSQFSEFSSHKYDDLLKNYQSGFTQYYYKLRRYAGADDQQHLDEH